MTRLEAVAALPARPVKPGSGRRHGELQGKG